MAKVKPFYYFLICFLIIGFKNLYAADNFKQQEFDSIQRLCEKYLNNYKNEEAYQLFEHLASFQIPVEDIESQANFFGLQSSIAGRKGDFLLQYQLLKKYESIAYLINTPDRIGSSYLSFASYYEQFYDYSNALPFFEEALKYYKKTHNELKIAYLYNKLGLIAFQEDRFKQAIHYFLYTYSTFQKHQYEDPENAYWMQNALTNIGLCYRYLNNYDKALKFYKYALIFSSRQAFERERPMAVIKTNIGVIYELMGKYDAAMFYLKQGLEDCLKPSNNELYHGINTLLYLTKIHRKYGHIEMAEKTLERALAAIKEHKMNQLMGSYYFNLAEIQTHQKRFEQANLTLKKYVAFKDSIQNLDSEIKVGKEFLTHELERQRDNNNLLEKENHIQGLRQKIYLGISLSILCILLIYFYNYKKLNKKNKELLGLNQQIIEQKEDLSILNEKLKVVNQNKNYLMQSIAHDLRAPIGNIISLNELMEAEADEHAELREYFPLIKGSCQLSINIIEDILDQSMIEKGSFDLHKSLHNVNQVILDSLDILKFKSAPKKITIQTNLSSDTQLNIDPERLKRVFINILMNAIKYSVRGSKIEINQYLENDKCIIQIKDEGIGMQTDTLAKIFEKHTSASKEGTEHEATIGIGLSITKLIVEGHGGQIRVESKPNSGSSFYIELPIS